VTNDMQQLTELGELRRALNGEIGKIIVGQQRVVDELLVTLFAGGHALIEGVPGLAKTLLISTVARALDLEFHRIQFTPDLMPSDVTGSEILEEDTSTGQRVFRFIKGPVFSNIVLADEINRTPPKTQAALLQAMQERQVTIGGETYDMAAPFFVLATQNPIEQEGTYPLPEAQLDRFMFNIRIDYPDWDEELQVIQRTTGASSEQPAQIVDGSRILELQQLVRSVPVADNVVEFAVRLTRLTRAKSDEAHAPRRTSCSVRRRWLPSTAGPRRPSRTWRPSRCP
jgi:MoxR-like ATPase